MSLQTFVVHRGKTMANPRQKNHWNQNFSSQQLCGRPGTIGQGSEQLGLKIGLSRIGLGRSSQNFLIEFGKRDIFWTHERILLE
jgi:hypothetical protein